MLFVYHGNNVSARKQALGKLREGLLQKRAEAEVFEIDADEFAVSRIQELTTSRGLFEEKYIVFLFHVLTTDHGQEAIIERIEAMKSAEHIFILVEDVISEKQVKKLKPHAEAIQEFPGQEVDSEFKPFPLSDAYGQRDKRTAWIELQKARAADQQAESLHGVLAWQTRLMLLAKECDSAQEAGVSGYPFKKAKQFGRNFSRQELEKNMKRLVQSYHEAHRGKYSLNDALEQFLLEL